MGNWYIMSELNFQRYANDNVLLGKLAFFNILASVAACIIFDFNIEAEDRLMNNAWSW